MRPRGEARRRFRGAPHCANDTTPTGDAEPAPAPISSRLPIAALERWSIRVDHLSRGRDWPVTAPIGFAVRLQKRAVDDVLASAERIDGVVLESRGVGEGLHLARELRVRSFRGTFVLLAEHVGADDWVSSLDAGVRCLEWTTPFERVSAELEFDLRQRTLTHRLPPAFAELREFLTTEEWAMFRCLYGSPGRLARYEVLIRDVLGVAVAQRDTIRKAAGRLRTKLMPLGLDVVAQDGVGYRLEVRRGRVL